MPLHDSHLLLVDDDPSALRVMSRLPARYPNQRMATSGVDAMRLAREHAPDLILLDADMPGMTGLDVCAALRADSGLSRVPVIFATSHDRPDLEVAALEAGAADFVNKPLVAAQITARVRSQLRRAAALRVGPGEATVPASDAGPARLLIVDDDVSAIHALRGALAPLGDFHLARNGDEALAMASELLPDGAMSLQIQAVDAAAAVGAAADAVGALALQAGVGVRVVDAPAPLAVRADPKRLHQCLLNLLTNGVKYCRAGSSVSVTLVGAETAMRIEVSDNGPGMTEAQCRHLFEPFNRLGREHDAMPGSGLGLAITRQLTSAMGGTLEVASELGAGSRFTMTLPLAAHDDVSSGAVVSFVETAR